MHVTPFDGDNLETGVKVSILYLRCMESDLCLEKELKRLVEVSILYLRCDVYLVQTGGLHLAGGVSILYLRCGRGNPPAKPGARQFQFSI